MSEWMTITILETGQQQRVRKSAISAYWEDRGTACVNKNGHLMRVKESLKQLAAELEDDPTVGAGA
jgi:hypothetical protein